jgi:hypothetical protein
MANEQLNQLLDEALTRHTETLAQFGGPAPVHLAEGGIPYTPTVTVKGSAREELDKIKSDYDLYNEQVTKFNDIQNAYKAQAEAYNKAATDYNNSFVKNNGQMVIAEQKMSTPANVGVKVPNGYAYYTANDKGELAAYTPTQDFSKAIYTAAPDAAGFYMVRTADIAAPGAIPVAPTAKAPTAPAVTQEQYNAKAEAAKKDASLRQTAVNAAFDPAAYGLSMNKLFAHGGPVHRAEGSSQSGEVSRETPLTDEEIAAASQPAFLTPSSGRGRQAGPVSQALNSGEAYPAIARGVSETPYNLVGAPVDLATMAMRPFGYKEEKPMMGSEWIKEKMTQMGVRPGQEANAALQGFRTMGELGASAVNPGPVAAKAGKVAEKGIAAAGKEVARQVLRGIEGEGILKSVSPPMAYAVKPRGGTFATSGSLDAPPLSKMDEMLDSYATRAQQEVPESSKDIVKEFIDKKARKYFTTEYGTGDDALRNAIRTGDMPIMGRDVERFPPYLLHAAKDANVPGHEMAKQHLEKAYDNATNLEGHVLGLVNSSDADARRMFQEHMRQTREQQRQLMSAEGVPNAFQNESLTSHTLSDLEAYPSTTRSIRRLMEAGEQGTLPSGVQGAMQRQQPIYDVTQPYMEFLNPRTVAENIAALPPNKLKNMSFADAMVEGSKKLQVFRDYDTAIAKAERGGNLPKEVTELYTKPFLKGDTGEWRQITEPRATDLEGKLMGHSVGGYRDGETYGTTYTGLPYGGKKAFEEGLVKVYSLRNDKGQPTVTLEMAKSDGGKGDKWNITQIRGPFNSEPAKNQWDDIFKMIDKGGDHIGTIKQNSYSMDRTGQGVPQGTVVDWGREYDSWKNGIPSENYAKGGSVERKTSDNRRYL